VNSDKQKVIAEFSKCPVCGSTRRFAESVAAEQKGKGLMGKDLPVGVWEFAGPLFDPRMATKMILGTKVPTVRAVIDVCLDCGAVYAVRLERGEASLTNVVARPKMGPPPGPGFMPPAR